MAARQSRSGECTTQSDPRAPLCSQSPDRHEAEVTHAMDTIYPATIQRQEHSSYLVPFVEEDDHFFLKTIIPSRKATRDFITKESDGV